MKLALAHPEHAQTVADFYSRLHGADFPHPELLSADTTARLIRDEEVAVIMASDNGTAVGCGLAWPRTWNQSLEIGALSVVDHPQRTDIAKALFEALRRLGLKRYGIAFFRAPNESAFRRGREIGASCWGFRPTPGSKSINDAEMIMGFFEEGETAMRVPPPKNAITSTAFAQRLIEDMMSDETDLPYPKNFPVGAPRGTGTVVISGRIWPTYHSRGNYITLENSAGPYPVEIINEFVEKVRSKGVTDIRLALPVNQEEAFTKLIDLGFTPTAYLPGWFLRGPHRFDCVQMAAGTPRIPRHGETFIERAVAKVVSDLTP